MIETIVITIAIAQKTTKMIKPLTTKKMRGTKRTIIVTMTLTQLTMN